VIESDWRKKWKIGSEKCLCSPGLDRLVKSGEEERRKSAAGVWRSSGGKPRERLLKLVKELLKEDRWRSRRKDSKTLRKGKGFEAGGGALAKDRSSRSGLGGLGGKECREKAGRQALLVARSKYRLRTFIGCGSRSRAKGISPSWTASAHRQVSGQGKKEARN